MLEFEKRLHDRIDKLESSVKAWRAATAGVCAVVMLAMLVLTVLPRRAVDRGPSPAPSTVIAEDAKIRCYSIEATGGLYLVDHRGSRRVEIDFRGEGDPHVQISNRHGGGRVVAAEVDDEGVIVVGGTMTNVCTIRGHKITHK